MNFLKNNALSILSMTFLFTMIMLGDASAAPAAPAGKTVFTSAAEKLIQLFRNAKMVVFIIGGFGLIALAFQAIFGKVKWAWFAALGFGLAVVAAAGAIINYAANTRTGGESFSDSLGNNYGYGTDTF